MLVAAVSEVSLIRKENGVFPLKRKVQFQALPIFCLFFYSPSRSALRCFKVSQFPAVQCWALLLSRGHIRGQSLRYVADFSEVSSVSVGESFVALQRSLSQCLGPSIYAYFTLKCFLLVVFIPFSVCASWVEWRMKEDWGGVRGGHHKGWLEFFWSFIVSSLASECSQLEACWLLAAGTVSGAMHHYTVAH